MQTNREIRKRPLVAVIVAAGILMWAYAARAGIKTAERAQAQGSTQAEAKAQAATTQGGKSVEKNTNFQAKGSFEPTLVPQPPEDKAEGSVLGRMSIAKKFHGDLEATSEGQMLTATTEVKGSAGYVAMERVSGTLQGRRGSFVLQHTGTLNHGAAQLGVSVVPDSGTGQLAGIAGTMTIQVAADGKHSYELDYTLPEKP
jgi:uncharacterized protein DUF3224